MMFRLVDTRRAELLRRHGAIAALAALVIACFAALAAIGAIDRHGAAVEARRGAAETARATLDSERRALIAFATDLRHATDGPAALRGTLGVVDTTFAALHAAAAAEAAAKRDAAAFQVPRGAWPFAAIAVIGVTAILSLLALLIARLGAAEREIARRAAAERDLSDRLANTAASADRTDELSRAKSRFFAQITHELRTPLNAIIGFSEAIRHQLFGPVANPRYREYAGLINDAGTHLLSLINDLLDGSRIEAGKMEIAPVRVAPAALARSALDLVELLAEGRSVAIATSGIATCPDLNVDPRAMKQVLVNLLSNAIKYTPAGGRIELRFAARDGGGAAIDIADTGIGMSAEDLRVAFEPFGRANAAEARSQQGTGLGLSLARSLVRLHGGELTLASRLRSGTTATVLLPASAVLALEGRPATPAEEPGAAAA